MYYSREQVEQAFSKIWDTEASVLLYRMAGNGSAYAVTDHNGHWIPLDYRPFDGFTCEELDQFSEADDLLRELERTEAETGESWADTWDRQNIPEYLDLDLAEADDWREIQETRWAAQAGVL